MADRYTWSGLTHLQVGRYAEYFVKMEFTMRGFDVYSAEVDDKGIDFVIRREPGRYYDIQVKSSRNLTYVFFPKTKFCLTENTLAAIVLFFDQQPPFLYIIPSVVWKIPNTFFVERNYDKPGQTSTPEWGLNLSKKNLHLLEPYTCDHMVTLLS